MRKSWKTKNFNPNHNPLLEESSAEEEGEYGEEDEETNGNAEEEASPISKIRNIDRNATTSAADEQDMVIMDTKRDMLSSRIMQNVSFANKENRGAKSANPGSRINLIQKSA